MVGRLRSTAVALVVLGVSGSLAAGSASAASLAVEDHGPEPPGGGRNMWIVYRADPGEANHLTITLDQQAHKFTVNDPLIPIRPDTAHGDLATMQQACTFLGTSVTCDTALIGGYQTYEALLGDRNDSVATKGADDFHEILLDGGPGSDGFRAGVAGHDSTDLIGGPGADDFHGGGGTAVVEYSDHTQGVTVTADDQPNDGAPGEGDNVHNDVTYIDGTAYDDSLSGGSHPVNLAGVGGNDTLTAGSADSGLFGGDGNDRLTGGGGNDNLDGGPGDDAITAGDGSDRVSGGDGDDTILTRESSLDRVHCDGGSDAVTADGEDAVTPDCESVSRPSGYVSPLTEFPITTVPPAQGGPDMRGIAAGADGNLWAVSSRGNEIDRISAAGSITGRFPIPTPSSGASDIAAGPDGNLWFTEGPAGKIGRVTTDGAFTEFPAPSVSSIAAGPDGNIWFAGGGSGIGRITPEGMVSSFSTPDFALTGDVARGPDGSVWFTQSSPTRAIGKVDPDTGSVTEYTTGLTDVPGSITAGPDGNLWFTEGTTDRVGRITPAGAITEYSWPLARGSGPSDIVAGPDGNLYLTESYGQGVARLTTAGQETGEWATGNAAREVVVGPDGNVWLTEAGAVARLALGG
jgi:streptogramin lyase